MSSRISCRIAVGLRDLPLAAAGRCGRTLPRRDAGVARHRYRAILVLWVGYGFVAIVVLCALMVFFPILVSTVVGLRHIDRELLEAAALDGATGWSMAWHMELPLAAPAILGGLRNGFALSVTGAVVGEMVMGGTGLGQVLTQMRNNVDTAGMFVIIIILCTMATLLYTIVYRIERSKRYDITQ